MLTIEHRAEATDTADERLELPYELRVKSRLRTRLASGEDVGLFLPRGQVLRHGDLLLASDGRVIQVVAAAEPLLEARAENPLLLLRAAYHLGNRHHPVQLLPGSLRCGRDHVIADLLRRLGLQVSDTMADFDPEPGAYAHGH